MRNGRGLSLKDKVVIGVAAIVGGVGLASVNGCGVNPLVDATSG